jgi:DNA (cytosine-5)-methyltransferase 1
MEITGELAHRLAVARLRASGNSLRPLLDDHAEDDGGPIREEAAGPREIVEAAKSAPVPNLSHARWRTTSLFSGCGGLDLGFHWEGFRTERAYDFNRTANLTFNRNVAPVARLADLSICAPPVDGSDVLLAGAPCQGFSTAGKRDLDDPRNALLMRAANLALTSRPRVVVMENVPAAMSGQHGRLWLTVEDMLRWYGYNVRRFVAVGHESGIAQRRSRLFMICWYGSDCVRIEPDPLPPPTLRQVLDGVASTLDHDPAPLRSGSRELAIASRIPPGAKLCNVRISERSVHTWDVPEVFGAVTDREREVLVAIVRLRRRARRRDYGDGDPVLPSAVAEHLGRNVTRDLSRLVEAKYVRRIPPYVELTHTYNGKFRRLDWDAPSPTVDTHFGDPALFLHPDEDRGLTPREAARIQGFPDDFSFQGSRRDRFRLIGNAVPPPMAARLGRFVREALL